jgi:CRP-like cAMP-binding protein
VILREWLLNVGQRDALQRLSHFFCEMADRLQSVGEENDDGSFDLPVNQVTLADTLGLTTVHVNRILKRLRGEGLIKLSHRRLAILDRDRLARLGGFDGAYLSPRRGRN